VLTRVLGRARQPSSFFFMYSIITRVDSEFVRYIRLLEFGDAVGLGQRFMESMSQNSDTTYVDDYQYTSDTQQALNSARTNSRNQVDDMTVCKTSFQTLKHQSEKLEKTRGVIAVLFVSEHSVRDGTLFECLNMEPTFFERIYKEFRKAPRISFNLCHKFWVSYRNTHDLLLSEQLSLVNSLEPKFIHFPFTKDGHDWHFKSTKQAILDDNFELVRTFQLRHAQNIPTTRKRKPSTNGSARFNRSTIPHTASLESLKLQFIAKGFFRVIQRDKMRLTVVWNAYDACSGTCLCACVINFKRPSQTF